MSGPALLRARLIEFVNAPVADDLIVTVFIEAAGHNVELAVDIC